MRAALSVLAGGVLVLAAPAVLAQDVSEQPLYGDLSLDEGFIPDPERVAVTSGGSVEVNVGSCSYGYVADAPDVDLYYTTSGGSDLYLYVEGEGDTTLLVNTPKGSWVCDDDGYDGTDPIVVIRNAPSGLYDIWVGSYSDDHHDATLYVSELDPRTSASAGVVPDYTLQPTYGEVTLKAGFIPDPYSTDIVAGGSIQVDMGECTYGYVAEAPDFDLHYQASGNTDLYIYAVGDEDTTLLVNTSVGEWVCDDDSYQGTDPLIVLPSAGDGLYDIWVGSYGSETTEATLYISEIDPR